MDVTLFTDGSALGNPGPGGWATLLRRNGRETLLTGGCPERTTNNRMELTAVLAGLQALAHPSRVTVVTDSEYVRGVLSLGWTRKANQDLLAQIDRLLAIHQVSFQVVKAHNGHPENERVDATARTQAEQARLTGRASVFTSDPEDVQEDAAPQAETPLTRGLHERRVTAFSRTLLALADDLEGGRVCLQDFDQPVLARLSRLLMPTTRLYDHTGHTREWHG